MSIEKIKHLKDGDVVFVPMVRNYIKYNDTKDYARFDLINNDGYLFLEDEDMLLTEQELREGFGSDSIKFGDMVYVQESEGFVFQVIPYFYLGYKDGWHWTLSDARTAIDSTILRWYEVKKVPPKTTLTLSEIEEKLGMASGSLIIKD